MSTDEHADPDPRTTGDGAPFSSATAVAGYADNARRLVPGLDALHRMTGLLLAEGAPDDARILVLGAGGGLELRHLASTQPGWRFHGVDPSGPMLAVAEQHLGDLASRVRLQEGYVDDAPDGPYDGAVCLLTLHFLPEDERQRTLEELRRRLAPGRPLGVAHHSIPGAPVERDAWLGRFAAFGISSGVPAGNAERGLRAVGTKLPLLAPVDDERLLREAGFRDVGLFYAAFTFRGWVATA